MILQTISVVVATYNRAELLRETLEAFCALKIENINWELIVVDNNSNDHSKMVIDSYIDKLPIRYLFEKKQGKNFAINSALDIAKNEIIVFADDDILPCSNWLIEISMSMNNYPSINIGGGKILAKWPSKTPHWLFYSSNNFPNIFQNHDLGEKPVEYPYAPLPSGANFWIRKTILDKYHIKFNTHFGPSGKNRISGSETEFLKRLYNHGEKMIYSPGAVVLHQIQLHELSTKRLLKRMFSLGRGEAHQQNKIFSNLPLLQYRTLVNLILKTLLKTLFYAIRLDKEKYMNNMFLLYFYAGQIYGQSEKLEP